MRRWLLLALPLLTAAVAFAALWLGRDRPSGKHETFGSAFTAQTPQDFTLMDQDGRSFSLGSLRGQFVLMTFGFTHCPNICPTTLGNLAAIYRDLTPPEQARLQVLFISIDPGRDTARILKDYVPFFDEHFIGLTGSAEQIAQVAKSYGVSYEIVPQQTSIAANSYTVNHSTYTYLVDPTGRWIALYNYEQLNSRQRMVDDLRHFLGAKR